MNIEYFSRLNDLIHISLTENQYRQFEVYYDLLIEKNKVMNLTAITEEKDFILKHFVDSILLAKYYNLNNKKIIDMGTGAGFPGIPLKIVFPDTEIVLMDSLNKRVKFLSEVINILELKNIEAVHSRAEDLGRDTRYREKFDVCVSRAVANLSTLSEYCIPFIKVNGIFISYKSGNIKEELDLSKNAILKLGAEIDKVEELELPDSDIKRTFIFLKKNSSTSNVYPRLAGKPAKEPIK
ncbi:16S rRNA (guanine(527)-N(7))-methyltransferase RsmG [Anaeromicropila populeti]|uniref:Ribosomal RNA small subunit methyltransferase G n=1 Tax=Anaeromicropila populeti TaxID=37658 RepID=A0A1I6LN45_9FIRM|nr:16S rRNA (guanine(527)-N(7))-methyltransferase RsmG [Anaeromicropila populeti]SFS04700.1 16S rRNA m(7)G-527 methyltransferase [Anaeromicropila populeti]